MIASNLVKKIHPICAQTKPKVSYLSTDVLIEHNVDSPPVHWWGASSMYLSYALRHASATAWLTLYLQIAYAPGEL
jgi:hypothetical protein